jgi:hypothetical protein
MAGLRFNEAGNNTHRDFGGALLGRHVVLESRIPFQSQDRPRRGLRGGGALFVVQESGVPEFELLTDSCVFEDNLCDASGYDILFTGLCSWLSYEDSFSNSAVVSYAVSVKTKLCHDAPCRFVPVFYNSTFAGNATFPPEQPFTVWPPPRTVICNDTPEAEPTEVPQADLLIAMPTGPPAQGLPFTVPPTQKHRFPTATRRPPAATEAFSESEWDPATKASRPAISGTMLIGLLVGVFSGVVTIGVVIWFWWYYRRKVDWTDDEYSGVMREVTVCDEQPEKVRNPIFCGVGGVQSIDPFFDDFETSTQDIEFV